MSHKKTWAYYILVNCNLLALQDILLGLLELKPNFEKFVLFKDVQSNLQKKEKSLPLL